MSAHRPREISRSDAERLLRGVPVDAQGGPELATVLAAVAAPAAEGELTGEDAAVAAFREARLVPAPRTPPGEDKASKFAPGQDHTPTTPHGQDNASDIAPGQDHTPTASGQPEPPNITSGQDQTPTTAPTKTGHPPPPGAKTRLPRSPLA